MSEPLPQHSLSTPNTSRRRSPVLPTPSSSTSASEATAQLRRELEQQIAEKEKQLQDPNNGIGKSVLISRQISQLKDKLREIERQQTSRQNPPPSRPLASPASSEDDLPPATLEKLRALERDANIHRGLSPTSPSISGHRKDKILGQRASGLDPLPSPSTSTVLPPPHGHDSSSLLPLPPPASGTTPTKRRSKVPNADRRNTDIEFATKIGQGLLVELRKQQALVREKEDQLAVLQAQKADLERVAESLAKQLRQKEETEDHLKEETWNLELARQELTMTISELQQNLGRANAEQARLAKQTVDLKNEVEHMRDREAKLSSTIEDLKTRHEADMSNLRRSYTDLQRQKTDYMKQAEKLSSELAIVKSQSRIAKQSHSELKAAAAAAADKVEEKAPDTPSPSKENNTPGTTPPPSPKQSPTRNQELEVETLKTSLAHAHRMLNTLRSNLQKEKMEKFELKKLLAESQEAIEQYQNDPRLLVDTDSRAGHLEGGRSGHSSKSKKSKRRVPVSKKRVQRPSQTLDATTTTTVTSATTSSDGEPRHASMSTSRDTNTDGDTDTGADTDTEGSTEDESGRESPRSPVTLLSELQNERYQDMETAEAPRTLSDELGVGNMMRPAIEGVAAGLPAVAATKGVEGVDIATQTEPAPPAAVHDGSVQTDPVTKPELAQYVLVSADHAPVEYKEQSVQSSGPSVTDAEIQTIPPVVVDTHVQTPVIVAVDSEMQTLVPVTVDTEAQTLVAVAVDTEVQTPIPIAVDASAQFEPAEYADKGIQFSSADFGIDQSIQPESIVTVDSGVQSDPVATPVTTDTSTQSDPVPAPLTRDMSVQSDPSETQDAGVQHSPICPETCDAETQYDVPLTETKDASSQCEPQEQANQAVAKTTVDVGVLVSEPTDKSRVASVLAAGAGALGLGALAKAMGHTGPPTATADAATVDTATADIADMPTVMSNVSPDSDTEKKVPVSLPEASTPVPVTSASVSNETEAADDHVKKADADAKHVTVNDTQRKAEDTEHGTEPQSESLLASPHGNDTSSTSSPTANRSATGQTPAIADDNDTKLYSKAEADVMIAAAVAAALAAKHTEPSIKDQKRPLNEMMHQRSDVPPRPTSPPPQRLLSRISQSPLVATNDMVTTSATASSSSGDKDKTRAIRRSLESRLAPHVTNDAAGGKRHDRHTLSSLSSLSVSDAHGSVNSIPHDSSKEGEDGQISLLAQTMIGDWLWKYTHKSLGGGFSDYRHKRFFWIHPYSQTLYWSNQAPGSHGKEPKAKSARIQGVSVVPDYGQDPEGLPNVSLLIKTTGRTIKLTASDMAHHNLWFEALSYLVARSSSGVEAGSSGVETAPTTEDPKKSPEQLKSFSETLSSGAESLLKKPSMQKLQGLFRSNPKSQVTRTIHTTHDGHGADDDHDDDGYDDDDEALEDVRMCCDGMHHVSHLERERIRERPYYRKRKSRQALRAASQTPTHHAHVPSPSA